MIHLCEREEFAPLACWPRVECWGELFRGELAPAPAPAPAADLVLLLLASDSHHKYIEPASGEEARVHQRNLRAKAAIALIGLAGTVALPCGDHCECCAGQSRSCCGGDCALKWIDQSTGVRSSVSRQVLLELEL